MKSTHSDIWDKLKQAETRLDSLSQEFQSLESEKRGYLQEIMRGRQLFREVKKADQAIKKKSLAISKAKEEEEGGSLRPLLGGSLLNLEKI